MTYRETQNLSELKVILDIWANFFGKLISFVKPSSCSERAVICAYSAIKSSCWVVCMDLI